MPRVNKSKSLTSANQEDSQSEPKAPDHTLSFKVAVRIDRNQCEFKWEAGQQALARVFPFEVIVERWRRARLSGKGDGGIEHYIQLLGEWILDPSAGDVGGEEIVATNASYKLLDALIFETRQVVNEEQRDQFKLSGQIITKADYSAIRCRASPKKNLEQIKEPSDTPLEPIEDVDKDVRSADRDLLKTQVEFDSLVDSMAAERQSQAARVQQALNSYLRKWDEEQQRLTREEKGRPAETIAQAKRELVDRITAAMERLDLSIYRDGVSCNLTVKVDEDHRRGSFWLTPRGGKNPVDHKAKISDLFNLQEGQPEINVPPPRREALVEYRAKVQASRQSNRSK